MKIWSGSYSFRHTIGVRIDAGQMVCWQWWIEYSNTCVLYSKIHTRSACCSKLDQIWVVTDDCLRAYFWSQSPTGLLLLSGSSADLNFRNKHKLVSLPDTVRPFQSSKKVLWLCIKNKLPYVEFYADSEIYEINGGRHKSYNIKFVRGTLKNNFEWTYSYSDSVVLGYSFSKNFDI